MHWINSDEVNEPSGCYTELSKSERGKQILYINTYIQNLKNDAALSV